jgi:hypothetical protein
MMVGVCNPVADGFVTFVLSVFVWPIGVVMAWRRLMIEPPKRPVRC